MKMQIMFGENPSNTLNDKQPEAKSESKVSGDTPKILDLIEQATTLLENDPNQSEGCNQALEHLEMAKEALQNSTDNTPEEDVTGMNNAKSQDNYMDKLMQEADE